MNTIKYKGNIYKRVDANDDKMKKVQALQREAEHVCDDIGHFTKQTKGLIAGSRIGKEGFFFNFKDIKNIEGNLKTLNSRLKELNTIVNKLDTL